MPTENSPDPIGRRLIDIEGVCTKLGIVDKRTVAKLVEEQGLPCIRISSRLIRYDAEAIDRWIDSRWSLHIDSVDGAA